MTIRMRAALLLLLGLLGPANGLWAWTGTTRGVPDGDSLNVVNPDGVQVHVRLYGIDAPERKQPFGYQARKRLIKLASRQQLDIEGLDTDRYGRTVALVRRQDGLLLNEAMVQDGLAWVYDQYCLREDLCARLRELQDQARSKGRGLWVERDPVRPADWRREHKSEEWYAAPVRAVKTIARKIKVVLHY